jgi:hypothetical protein
VIWQKALAIVGALGIVGLVTAPPASAQTISIQSASTTMTSTTNFTTATATATCPAGTTLVSGGSTLTRSGALVTNDGNVTLGVYPSNASATPSGSGALTPASWTTTAGYSGMAPGLDTVTTFAVCTSAVAAATEVEVSVSAANSLGPVTASCPAGTSLVGGGGGYTAFPGSNNTKVYDSFPSDAAGDVPANAAVNPTSWTFQGNSNSATGATSTAYAVCATDVPVTTAVATGSLSVSSVASGAPVGATAVCPADTELLAGGIDVTSVPSGPGTGGQGVHVIGDYPSDGSGNAATSGSAPAWTAVAQDGGQPLTSLATTALALCDTTSPGSDIPEATYPALMVALAGLLVVGFVLYRRRTTVTAA